MSAAAAVESRHIGQIFFQRAGQLGDRTFVKLQQRLSFEDISWQDFASLVREAMVGLIALGLAPGDTVAIIGDNCLPWLAADMATLAGGFPNVVISPSLSDLMFGKILSHAACSAVFVQDVSVARRVAGLRGQLPNLRHLIVMTGGADEVSGVVDFKRLSEIGCGRSEVWCTLVEAVCPQDLATIMYTSGSTGEPKGVMRTQDNLLANITNGGAITVSAPDELTVNILSLNHLFGRFGFLKSAVTGRTTALVEAVESEVGLAVIERLAPTGLAVVPRVMERIWQTMLDHQPARRLWRELESYDERQIRGELSVGEVAALDGLKSQLKTVVRDALGGRIKYIAYGGAAMAPRIMRFFELIGIPLIGSYGSTECGGVTLCGIGENRPGNLGKPFANVQLRIAEDSEILVRGPTVSPGYFKNPEATREAFDADGWYHTGDLGLLEADGSLRITGRKKDIFNCADGSNIYPAFIELQLENEPCIDQAVLLGDRRPFIAALIVPDRRRIAESLNRDIATLTDEEIAAALWPQIERVNGRLEAHEKIRRITIMSSEFPTEVRSINHFQKIKVDRERVAAHYRQQIDAIYAAAGELN